MATKEVQLSSAVDEDVHPTPSLHITSNNLKGYGQNTPEIIVRSYVADPDESIELFDGPWQPEVRRKLGLEELPVIFIHKEVV